MSNISIPGFDRYFVTNEGQIIGPKGFPLHGGEDKNGYILVTLREDGKSYTRKVHRLVCAAFYGEPSGLPFVNHIDGNKANNHPSNLEWVTARENTLHSYRTGLQQKGENHGRAKISDEDVQYIRDNIIPRDPEFGGAALGRKFGITRSQVNRIAQGLFR